MSQRVRITDVSPRDGLQNEPGVIASVDKISLVELLARTGVDEVEVTSFVSPKWVPQLGDAGAVLEGLWKPSGEGRGGGGARSLSITYARPPQDPCAVERSRQLRAEQTGPEAALWSQLRRDELVGAHFLRQHPFGPFILDFFCHDLALAIEVDGRSHSGAAARQNDQGRSAFVERCGVTVVRVSNDQVVSNLDGVVRRVQAIVRQRRALASMPTPHEALDAAPPPAPHTAPPLPLPSGEGLSAGVPVLSALVPNEKGMDAAAALIAKGAGLGKLGVFTAASESFCRKNIGASIEESLGRFVPVIARCKGLGVRVRGYVSCVVACPFEGPIEAGRVAEVCERLVGLGVDELDLGDTIGAGTPATTREVIRAVLERVGPGWLTPDRLTLHLHDTFGEAPACVRAALGAGVRSFDGSVAGLGGCPYASTPGRRAPGNIATEVLVATVRAEGFSCGLAREIDDAALAEAAAFARAIVGRARAGERGGGGA